MGLANTFSDYKSNIVQQEDATIFILISQMVLTPLLTPSLIDFSQFIS